MGLIRKTMSISTMGAVGFRSNGEKTARNTKQMARTMRQAQKADRHRSEADLQWAVLESRDRASRGDRQPSVGHGAASSPTLMAELTEVASLHASGALTEAEFAAAKAKLLA